jgi:hypothetical protein
VRGPLTERDRFWLEHLKRIEMEGGEAKAYARCHDLSAQALYQAKKRLVERGAWSKLASAPPRFARVTVVAAPPVAPGGFRLRLPGGALLEWERPPELAVLTALVDRVASLR